jgi:hypothetical protein
LTEPTNPATDALRVAGAALAATLREAGTSMVAQVALGQIIAGNPQAATGMLTALDPAARATIVSAAADLLGAATDADPDLAAHAAEVTNAARMHELDAAAVFRLTYLGRPIDAIERLTPMTDTEQQAIAHGARLLLACVLDVDSAPARRRRAASTCKCPTACGCKP